MLHMSRTVIKNLLSKSATRLYPVEQREPFADVRGALDINIEDCIFCGTCARKCPSAAIQVSKEDGLWEVNPFLCVYCATCVEACPTKCLFHHGQYRKPYLAKENIVHQHVEADKSE